MPKVRNIGIKTAHKIVTNNPNFDYIIKYFQSSGIVKNSNEFVKQVR